MVKLKKQIKRLKKDIEKEEDILTEIEEKARLESLNMCLNKCNYCGAKIKGKHCDIIECNLCGNKNTIFNVNFIGIEKKINLQKVIIQNVNYRYKKLELRSLNNGNSEKYWKKQFNSVKKQMKV